MRLIARGERVGDRLLPQIQSTSSARSPNPTRKSRLAGRGMSEAGGNSMTILQAHSLRERHRRTLDSTPALLTQQS